MTGDVLSSNPKSTYIFEPFARFLNESGDEVDIETNCVAQSKIEDFLMGLFSCKKVFGIFEET